jgi:glycosyltransferase involved in cell wall biosynthesis
MRICLSMIVKNESAVIERCLQSVRPFIHAWAIADTGSSDGTQAIVRRTLADLPGELIERPWVDFSTNRNQALQLAAQHGEYALIIDADEVLESDPGFAWPKLDAPGYLLELVYGDTRYRRVALPRLDGQWEWRGVLHEALNSEQAANAKFLPGLRIKVFSDGARSQQTQEEKFTRDAEVLRKALLKEPDNARYAFYLAQSLRDAGKTAESIVAYEKRVAMGGWAEEVYFSKLQIGALKERLGAAPGEIMRAYLEAYDYRPARAEAPCEFARYCRLQQRYVVARDFARIAAAAPLPDDVLFIDRTVYDWRARDELAVAAYWCGDRELSAKLCRELLADPRLPDVQRERMTKNLGFAEGTIAG